MCSFQLYNVLQDFREALNIFCLIGYIFILIAKLHEPIGTYIGPLTI